MSLTIDGVGHDPADVTPEQLGQWQAECMAAWPTGRYSTILVDPCWQFKGNTPSLQGCPKYPVMSLDELKALPVGELADPRCSVLYMWACSPLLDQAIQLGQHWGFRYVTVAHCWVKTTAAGRPVMACGRWQRPSTELLLVFVKGKGHMALKRSCSTRQLVFAQRGRHSEKPREIRQLLTEFMDAPRGRLEMFSREQQPVPGWDMHGLEVPGYFMLAAGGE
jgi:N6-adenosine-specific RNA methylase IME4